MRWLHHLVGGIVASLTLSASAVLPLPASAASTGPLSRTEIAATGGRVDAYWKAHGINWSVNNWMNAVYHVGNLSYQAATGARNTYTSSWAADQRYAIATSPYGPFFPDAQATGEVYLGLQAGHPTAAQLTATRAKVNALVASVTAGHRSYWYFVDALNMAMPTLAGLGVMDRNQSMLTTMQTLFGYTEKQAGGHGLFNEKIGLWWRGIPWVGKNVYWSRGNGWVMMALVKVITILPATDPRRPEYLRVFVKMAAAVKARQRSDGFWNVNLGDPTSYPGPETSGTSFFLYAIARGINSGLLPASVYRPVAERAWTGLVGTAVTPDGLLGYVQGQADEPSDHQPVTATDQAAFAVGGFLMGAAEMYKLER